MPEPEQLINVADGLFVRAGDLSDERGFVHGGRVGAERDAITHAGSKDPAYICKTAD